MNLGAENNRFDTGYFKDIDVENGIPSGGGGGNLNNPLGTIISYMGTTPPANYLACDGTVYNITDYQELADFINTQFGSYDYFGGNGTTTFAVPDLRGEFLRGTGTNSHTNQGSGANVGVHQDGTEHPYTYAWANNCIVMSVRNSNTTDINNGGQKHDSTLRPRVGGVTATATAFNANGSYAFTSRPTNTSVLYCIRYNTPPPPIQANAIRDVLYTGSTNIPIDTNWEVTVDLSGYDYVLIRVTSHYNGSEVYYSTDKLIELPNDNVSNFFYKWGTDASISFDGWIMTQTNKVMVGVRTRGANLVSVFVESITGIKLVNPNVYSTTEQRIGTWIDGKPLYQKTFQVTTPTSSSPNDEIVVSQLNYVDSAVNVEGYVNAENGHIPIFLYWNSTNYVSAFFRDDDKTLRMGVAERYQSLPAVITLQYTKTTD